jgi:hypothetical protein
MGTTNDLFRHLGGIPAGTGDIPMYMGGNANSPNKIYYVDGFNGSDGNDGENPDNPLATIAAAITLSNATIDWSATPWASRNVIIIQPGSYAENLTSLPYGALMIGVGPWDNRDAQMGVKIKPASGVPVDVNAAINMAIYNIGFESTSTSRAFDATILNNCLFYNCLFTGAAETATAGAALYTSDCTYTRFYRCRFCNADQGMSFNYVDAGDGINYLDVDDCIISGCDTDGIYVSTNLVGPHSRIRNTHIFGGGQTMAEGVDDNSAILELSRCDITATDPVDGCRAANGCYGNGSLLDGTGA